MRLGPSRPAVILNAASQKDRRRAQLFPLLTNAVVALFLMSLKIGLAAAASSLLALLHSGYAPAKLSEPRSRPQRQHLGDAVSVGVAPPPQSSRRSTYAGRWRRMPRGNLYCRFERLLLANALASALATCGRQPLATYEPRPLASRSRPNAEPTVPQRGRCPR